MVTRGVSAPGAGGRLYCHCPKRSNSNARLTALSLEAGILCGKDGHLVMPCGGRVLCGGNEGLADKWDGFRRFRTAGGFALSKKAVVRAEGNHRSAPQVRVGRVRLEPRVLDRS